jgi:glucosamine-6-phosphate deaminase
MKLQICDNAIELGVSSGSAAARMIEKSIESKGSANIVLATGISQFNTISQLVSEPISWDKVVMFHLDEYIGLPISHPASFRRYLQERFISRVKSLKQVNLINGETDPLHECDRLGELISSHPIDVALVGVGENGHLAFNDPPADFETEQPYLVVELDEACRKQQLGEGWFHTLEEVPVKAISMSIRLIMKSKSIICSVPERRKAMMVKNCMEGPVSNLFPASILQQHPNCTIYLDNESASLLDRKKKSGE